MYLFTLEAPYVIYLAMIRKEHYDPEQRDEFIYQENTTGVLYIRVSR